MRSEADPEFVAYVRARQHRLLRAAYLVCGDVHLAEDLLQEAFVKLALRWDRLRDERPDAYVRTIVFRDAVSAWRKRRREELAGLDVPESRPWPASEPGERVDVQRALESLTAKQRAVLVLRYLEDRSEAQTAQILGVSVGTVKSTAHDALSALRTRVPDLLVEELR
jgi:RNA polymerase sigma-70 factor (sigma-E family)